MFCDVVVVVNLFFVFWVFVFSEAQGGFGEAAEPTASTSGSLVSKPKGKVRYFRLDGGALLAYWKYIPFL